MVLGSAVAMDESTPFPGTAALVPVLGTALLVAAGARLPDGLVSSTLSRPAASVRRPDLLRLVPLALAGAGAGHGDLG